MRGIAEGQISVRLSLGLLQKCIESTKEKSMETSPERQNPPDMSRRQTANQLIKLIRKLRWIGMGAEEEELQTRLRQATPEDTVLAAPQDTD